MDRPDLKHALTQLTDECIHCGLCLEACPTYALKGAEPDSPRGRIHLMKALVEGRLEPAADVFGPLDRCLGCRACETACPSSVQYGHLLEAVRADYVVPHRPNRGARALWKGMLDHLLPYSKRLRFAMTPVRLAPKAIEGLKPLLPSLLRRQLDLVGTPPQEEPPIPEWTPAVGDRRGTVAFLTGCVMDALYRPVNRASVRMLARAGFDVWVPRAQGCCGALHMHEGDCRRAQAFMRTNLEAFRCPPSADGAPQDLSAVIVNSAGCGAAMKDYGTWLAPGEAGHSEAAAFGAKVKDICEFLDEVGLPEPPRALSVKATYHEPCHLTHGQRIKEAPRRLLQRIPGLSLVPLKESDWCCGGAGSYTFLQPEMAEQLLARKLDNLAQTEAEWVITGNPSCLMQLGLGLRRDDRPTLLLHTVEVLDRAYQEPGASSENPDA
ncbi:4Fe-4S dicluster domain-containing protein [bacterium]|nr:4Fe-4S dicluster domain-containing protein [bacterium]